MIWALIAFFTGLGIGVAGTLWFIRYSFKTTAEETEYPT